MRIILTNCKSVILLIIILGLLSFRGYSQSNAYKCYLKNIKTVSPTEIEFDIWIEWMGNNQQKFQAFQGGIDFNYSELANGGVITGRLVPGTVDPALSMQQNPKWIINERSHQIRLLAKSTTSSDVATVCPSPPGFRLGTFRMSNTVSFPENIKPEFTWYFGALSGTLTKTKVSFYLNGETRGTDVTVKESHVVVR